MRVSVLLLMLCVSSCGIANEPLKGRIKIDEKLNLIIEIENISKIDICVRNEELPIENYLFVDTFTAYDVNGNQISTFKGIEPSLVTNGGAATLMRYFLPGDAAMSEILISEFYDFDWKDAARFTYGLNYYLCGDLGGENYLEMEYFGSE